jgi:hypothetical protein
LTCEQLTRQVLQNFICGNRFLIFIRIKREVRCNSGTVPPL